MSGSAVKPPVLADKRRVAGAANTAGKPAQRPAKRKTGPRKPKPGKREAVPPQILKWNFLLIGCEAFGLLTSAALATMLVLGYSANRFTGTGFFSNLLPFAIGVVALIVVAAVFLIVWVKARSALPRKLFPLPALISLGLAAALVFYIFDEGYRPVFTYFRGLVGGREQAARTTLAHQVYAAYRRYDENELLKLIGRSQVFTAAIKEAAERFDVDPEILLGVAAAESSFLPRDSNDGGHGLFQITSVPKFLLDQVRRELEVDKLSLPDPRHNAYLAAATLKYYFTEMNGDLFLGLLAYNIGPKNGGLKFIMEQYGATDFVSMQPYLQTLPRDYPIRVLSYSLAFRVWQHNGKLLSYQESDNAMRIQKLGIPGLQTGF